MFKAEMSNGVYYGFDSFKELYQRVLKNLRYVVHQHKSYDTESALIYANGKCVCWLYVTTYTVCIRSFATQETTTRFIMNDRGKL